MADDNEGGGTSGHTSGRMSGRIEVVGRVSGRRRWSVEQKLAILRDAFGAEGSVRLACERHEVGSGQLYTWRRQAMSGELAGIRAPALPAFAAVELSEPAASMAPPSFPCASGQIAIDLPSGVRLTVDAAVDADALARVIAVLGR
ncbi:MULTISPECIES: IS66-like element accessory protein TnpA [unclassified Sphingomonas]|uniref:IS66-like element accessory protein TnpA n=1 Tax=unclassified Sphingomonas TaxID=196159 RepID=UPI000A563BE9|nr:MULTISPECIES: transposase [unclassified Sphingomonas]